jgi:hypothetical protein
MNYKLITDIQDTWFYEFYPGKINGKRKYSDSVYLSLDAVNIIDDCLHKANNNYGIFPDRTKYTKEKGQIQLLAEELKTRLAEIIENKDFSGQFSPLSSHDLEINNDLKKYKTEIIEMINGLIGWLENLKENELTVIGTAQKIADLILGDE